MLHACIIFWDIFTNINYKRETCTAKKKRECCNKVKHVQTIEIRLTLLFVQIRPQQ